MNDIDGVFDAELLLRDDALLDALGRGELPAEFSDDLAGQLLLGWREDIVAGAPELLRSVTATVTSPVAEDTAVLPVLEQTAILAAFDETAVLPTFTGPADNVVPMRPSRRPQYGRRALVAGAAAVAVGLGSLGSVAAAGMAEPGDALFPITKVVYADRAASLEAREDARESLKQAREAADRGDKALAEALVAEAAAKATQVRPGDGRSVLEAEVATVRGEIGPVLPVPSPSAEPTPQPSPSASPSPSAPVEPPPAPSTSPEPTPEPSPQSSPEPTPETTSPTPDPPAATSDSAVEPPS